jgi:hypothetical protein
LRLVSSLKSSGSALLCAAALSIALPGVVASGGTARASVSLEERKLPMRFSWVACASHCAGYVKASGIVTSETLSDFDDFARGRQLGGATIVLDSSGGSVNDAIALGRRWHKLGVLTTVGAGINTDSQNGDSPGVVAEGYCESMCVFLLLSGKTRYVPDGAHVRVHQIWMGDRADDAKAASYTARDLMIVERDIGRLAKYTFEMGGSGDLLLLALSVPPWEDLHELSPAELRLTNLITTEAVADILPKNGDGNAAVAQVNPVKLKPVQDRFVSSTEDPEHAGKDAAPLKSTKTAEATPPTGGTAAAQPQR